MRIYFNRCFTTTAKAIKTMIDNKNGDKFEVFISHAVKNNYLEEVADYFEVEPPLQGKEYVDYCLAFCKKHKVDLFVPRYNVDVLVQYKEEFENIGVKVMFVGTPDTYKLISDKFKTYEDLDGTGIVKIPKSFAVANYADFKIGYKEIRENGSAACMKPIVGIGGEGFRRISENISELDELYTTKSAISKDRLERVLNANGTIEPFLLSEYLEDEEFSIDCLGNNGELLIGVPRRKVDCYRQNIEYREELIEIAKNITKRYNLSYLYNIQVKYHKGEVYLVEINTRMSGGLYKACFTGVNFLNLAVKMLAGEEVVLPNDIRWNFQMYIDENYKFSDLIL